MPCHLPLRDFLPLGIFKSHLGALVGIVRYTITPNIHPDSLLVFTLKEDRLFDGTPLFFFKQKPNIFKRRRMPQILFSYSSDNLHFCQGFRLLLSHSHTPPQGRSCCHYRQATVLFPTIMCGPISSMQISGSQLQVGRVTSHRLPFTVTVQIFNRSFRIELCSDSHPQ